VFTGLLLLLLAGQGIVAAQDLTELPVESVQPDTLNPDSLAEAMRQDSINQADTVEYRATTLFYNYPSRTFELKEKAQLKYQGATLDADTIEYDQQNFVLQATGIPILKDRDNPPIIGYRMKYNIKKKIGQIYYGSTKKDGQHFNGMDIRRLEDGRLQIARGDFCACQAEDPNYHFYGRRMTVEPKEKIVARPVVLNIQDVPIAVLPMLISPLQSGRRSGMLVPRFGGDQSQGFYLRDVGFYWATNDYMDFLAKGDLVEGENATFDDTRANAQFRYNKRYVLNGNIDATAYVEEFNPSNSGWDVRFSHNQNITPDQRTRLTGAGSFVSRSSLRQDRGLDAETILDQQANAHMTLERRFRNGASVYLRTRQDHNLTTGRLEREIPDLQLSMSGPLFSPSSRSVSDTSLDLHWYEKLNYSYSWHGNVFYRQERDTVAAKDTSQTWTGFTNRLTLDYSGSLFDVINVTPAANFQGDWSAYSWDSPDDSLNQEFSFRSDPANGEFGDFFLRHWYSLSTDTKLFGIWRPEWGRFTGIRHTISPGLSYTFAPEIDTNETFVPHPRIHQGQPFQTEQQTIGMSLGNDFDLKYQNAAEDGMVGNSNTKGEKPTLDSAGYVEPTYTTLKFLQLNSNTSYNFAADSFHWADISSRVTIQPVKQYAFSVNTRHSVYHRFSDQPKVVQTPELTYYAFGLEKSFNWNGKFNSGIASQDDGTYLKESWNASFRYSLGYSSTRIGEELFQDNINHTSTASLDLYPTENWNMRYSTRYDFNEGKFASHRFVFNRSLKCWRMQFTWTPVGTAAGWSFFIYITDLPDIKFQTSNTELNRDR